MLFRSRTEAERLLRNAGIPDGEDVPDKIKVRIARRLERYAYLGLPIRRYRLQDGRILYACQAYGLTLCAFAREALAHCLDQAVLHMIGGIQAAHGEKAWLTRHRRLPDKAGEFFCYANIAGLRVQPLWASALEPLWQDMPPEQAIIDHRVRSRADSLNLTLRFAPGLLDA